jgi:hypothetical protein
MKNIVNSGGNNRRWIQSQTYIYIPSGNRPKKQPVSLLKPAHETYFPGKAIFLVDNFTCAVQPSG